MCVDYLSDLFDLTNIKVLPKAYINMHTLT